MPRRPTAFDPVDRLVARCDELEALLSVPSARVAAPPRHAWTPRRPAIDLVVWRHHVAYARRGEEAHRAFLVDYYHPQAQRIASHMHRSGTPREDLEQVASEALLLALDRFDPDRGIPFIGYARPTITGAIKRHFRDEGWALRVPRRAHELAHPIATAEEALGHDLRRAPTDAEIADYLGVPLEDIQSTRAAAHARGTVSLDRPDPHEDHAGGTAADRLDAEDDEHERADARMAVEQAAQLLSDEHREVLGLYFEDGLTQTEVAARLGVSQMQVSRLVERALRQLRSHLPS